MSAIARIQELANEATLCKVDSQRWEIAHGPTGKWLDIPAVVNHRYLDDRDVVFAARFAPRKVAAAALKAYRRGEWPQVWRIGEPGPGS